VYIYICMYRNRISKDIINQSRSSDFIVDRTTLEAKLIDRIINRSSDLIIAGKWNRSSDSGSNSIERLNSQSSNSIIQCDAVYV